MGSHSSTCQRLKNPKYVPSPFGCKVMEFWPLWGLGLRPLGPFVQELLARLMAGKDNNEDDGC